MQFGSGSSSSASSDITNNERAQLFIHLQHYALALLGRRRPKSRCSNAGDQNGCFAQGAQSARRMLLRAFRRCSCVFVSPSLSVRDRLGDTRLLYGRSAAIAERHDSLLGLIHRGGGSATALAETLGVSAATINRDLSYLRSKGHPIRARRSAAGWSYAMDVIREAKRATSGQRP